jgi:hypothetical protein
MARLKRNRNRKTYYSIGWTAHGSISGAFRDLSMPGAALRVMDKCVHRAAVESAGKKLRQLSHGRKALSL